MLRDALRLTALREHVAAWPEVVAATCNARAGSLLIHYDTAQAECAAIEARVTSLLDASGAAAPELPARRSAHGGTPRVKANRWAKRGMLASLGVSLALAAAGAKRWHALTGMMFLHALAVHLWAHRRHLLR